MTPCSLAPPLTPSAVTRDDLDALAQVGRWAPDPEDGAEGLIEAVCDPLWRNEDLLRFVLIRAGRCDPERRAQWLAQLLEFSIWETHSQPRRLELCQGIVESGIAPFHHAPSWRHFGGLLHVASEAGSLEAARWAYRSAPSELFSLGGQYGLTPLHCAASRCDPQGLSVVEALLEWGLSASAQTNDDRNALFRVQDPAIASALMRAGADPLQPDSQGYCALGYWLETGAWDLARLCFIGESEAPALADINAPLRFGSFLSKGESRPFLRELPAAIYALSASGARDALHAENLAEMARLGADFHRPGPRSRAPIEFVACGRALGALERQELSASVEPSGSGSSGRRL